MAIRCRNNSSVVKEEVVSAVADAVTQGGKLPHKVDLSAPDRMVIVEIIQVRTYVHTCSGVQPTVVSSSVRYVISVLHLYCMFVHVN